MIITTSKVRNISGLSNVYVGWLFIFFVGFREALLVVIYSIVKCFACEPSFVFKEII
jgi:hypothetical protein